MTQEGPPLDLLALLTRKCSICGEPTPGCIVMHTEWSAIEGSQTRVFPAHATCLISHAREEGLKYWTSKITAGSNLPPLIHLYQTGEELEKIKTEDREVRVSRHDEDGCEMLFENPTRGGTNGKPRKKSKKQEKAEEREETRSSSKKYARKKPWERRRPTTN